MQLDCYYTYTRNGHVQSFHPSIEQALNALLHDLAIIRRHENHWFLCRGLPESLTLLRCLPSHTTLRVAQQQDDPEHHQSLSLDKRPLSQDIPSTEDGPYIAL